MRSIMIWGDISVQRKSDLIRFNGNVPADRCIKMQFSSQLSCFPMLPTLRKMCSVASIFFIKGATKCAAHLAKILLQSSKWSMICGTLKNFNLVQLQRKSLSQNYYPLVTFISLPTFFKSAPFCQYSRHRQKRPYEFIRN